MTDFIKDRSYFPAGRKNKALRAVAREPGIDKPPSSVFNSQFQIRSGGVTAVR